MSDQNETDIAARVAALADEFPGFQFAWTEHDDASKQRYHISAQETESWANGEVQSATGDTIDAAIEQMRDKMRNAR